MVNILTRSSATADGTEGRCEALVNSCYVSPGMVVTKVSNSISQKSTKDIGNGAIR